VAVRTSHPVIGDLTLFLIMGTNYTKLQLASGGKIVEGKRHWSTDPDYRTRLIEEIRADIKRVTVEVCGSPNGICEDVEQELCLKIIHRLNERQSPCDGEEWDAVIECIRKRLWLMARDARKKVFKQGNRDTLNNIPPLMKHRAETEELDMATPETITSENEAELKLLARLKAGLTEKQYQVFCKKVNGEGKNMKVNDRKNLQRAKQHARNILKGIILVCLTLAKPTITQAGSITDFQVSEGFQNEIPTDENMPAKDWQKSIHPTDKILLASIWQKSKDVTDENMPAKDWQKSIHPIDKILLAYK
jgi:DNA-directed RNA polymerase specialized sigma24 family protein